MVDFATETIQPKSHLLQGFELALGLRLSTAFVFKQVPKSNPQLYGKKWGLEAPWSAAKLRSSTAGAISEAIIYFDFVCGGRETATSFESQTAESKASRSASCCSNSWMASGPGSSQNTKNSSEVWKHSGAHHSVYVLFCFEFSRGSWSLSRSSGMLVVKSSRIWERPRPRASVELTREAMVLMVSLRTKAIN